MTPSTIDLTDVRMFTAGQHHEVFDWLRANDPVHWHPTSEDHGFWVLSRYQDVVGAYGEHTVFSSEGGAVLGGSFGSEADSAAGLMLISSDPPRHRLLRQVLHRAFAPDVTSRVAARVRELASARSTARWPTMAATSPQTSRWSWASC
ncbi:MAG: hypothetical protein ABIQ18_45935 [Umezawaea sp.]